MEIIKHGDPEKIAQHKIFKCEYCGCEFKASVNEYHHDFHPILRDRYWCQCPECNKNVNYQHHESM